MTLWPHLVQMPWAKPLIVLGACFLLLGLCMACWSGHMNARALGANLGKGHSRLADEDEAPEQRMSHAAWVCVDWVLWAGIVSISLGVLLQTWGRLL
jgi:hypothetical protein